MADDANDVNRVEPAGSARSIARGDAPDWILRRYLLDERGGRGLGFYADATSRQATFRDRGDRLITGRSDPNAVRHMAEIARHRGWTTITVRGDTAFRREAWLAARGLGLEVRGYRPTVRDEQDLDRREAARRPRPDRDAGGDRQHLAAAGAGARMRAVEQVVRTRIAEPAEQARILAAARDRLTGWLERGATFEGLRAPERPTVHRERSR
jgi:hypothetical protein